MLANSPWTKRALMAGALAVLIATGAAAQNRGSVADALARSEREIDRELTTLLELGPAFVAFKELYPVEYRRLVVKLAEGGFDGDISRQDMEEAVAEMGAIRAKYAASLINAPNAELITLMEKRRDALRILRSDNPALCEALAQDVLNVSVNATGRRSLQALADIEIAQMRAAKAGFDTPLRRAKPSDDDVKALVQALLKGGADQRTIDQLLGDRTGANARERCNTAILLYDALDSMPARNSAAIMAMMIREAALELADRPGTDGLSPKERVFETMLAKDENAPLFDVLEARFPDQYLAVRNEYITELEDGGDIQDIVRDLLDQVFLLQVSYIDEIEKAGDRELLELVKARGAALKLARSHSAAFCTEFADQYIYDAPEDGSQELSTSLTAYEAALLTAIASSMNSPVTRPALDEDDMKDLIGRLARTGVSEDALMSFISGDFDALPARNRCDVAIALNDAIGAMPAKSAATLMGRLSAQMAERDEALAKVREELAANTADGDAAAEDLPIMAWLKPLSESFPEDFEAITDIWEEKPPARGEDTRNARVEARFEAWWRRNTHFLERAPTSELVELADAQRQLFEILQRSDVKACVLQANGDLPLDAKLSDEAFAQRMRTLGAFVIAIAAGRDRPGAPHSLSDGDIETLLKETNRRGATQQRLERMDHLPAKERCELEVVSHQALSVMPRKVVAGITVAQIQGLEED